MNDILQRDGSGSSSSGAKAGGSISVQVHAMSEWPQIAPLWDDLFRITGSTSVFLSRYWIETWLETYGCNLGASILQFAEAEHPVAVCLVVKSRMWRAIVPFRRLSLNAAGEAPHESTYIEYNDVLCRPGYEMSVGRALAAYLSDCEWDELTLDGMSPGPIYESMKHSMADFAVAEVEQPCYYIDLAEMRRAGKPYEVALRSRYRTTLRRNIRACSQVGPLQFECASGTEAALEMFDEMATLNLRRRRARAGGSAFESPRFLAFHRTLIRRCHGGDLIQLVRLRAGERTLGILYNLALAGKVNFYQCGYDYDFGPQISPGLVTHAYAVQYALEHGFDDWDCLAGDTLFKRSLSTGVRTLAWAVFRRPGLKSFLLNAGLAQRRLLQRMATKARRREAE